MPSLWVTWHWWLRLLPFHENTLCHFFCLLSCFFLGLGWRRVVLVFSFFLTNSQIAGFIQNTNVLHVLYSPWAHWLSAILATCWSASISYQSLATQTVSRAMWMSHRKQIQPSPDRTNCSYSHPPKKISFPILLFIHHPHNYPSQKSRSYRRLFPS